MSSSAKNRSDLGHWVCGEEVSEDAYGFVYKITNKTDKKFYIGKKQILSKRKLPPLKGKKRKRTVLKESDWKTYTGSSDNLNADIERLGKDAFMFEIVKICCSKSELAYFETKLQFDLDVLLKEEFYNGIINCRIGKIKLS